MTCGHCTTAIERELRAISGVQAVEIDLETKLVAVHGYDLDDRELRTAIDEAGYEAE